MFRILGRVGRHPRARSAGFLLGSIALACLFAPAVAPYDREAGSLGDALARASAAHWLGTDELGRDVLTRLLWGGRVSLSVAALVTVLALLFGLAYGLSAGCAPLAIGGLAMRLVDGALAVPRLPVYLVLLTIVGAGYWSFVLVMLAFEWTAVARLAYTSALGQFREPHVEAARSLGATWARLVVRHGLPAVAAPVLVAALVGFRGRIVAETSLSYLGFGIAPPLPSWGNMLAAAQSHVWDRPLLAVYPGLAILLVTIGANLLGDAVRDALDPASPSPAERG